jgi:serine protease
VTFRRALVALVAALVGTAGLAAPAPAATDPLRPDQWALDVIGAERAWSVATGHGATIAVVDTGIDLTHEDLTTKIVAHVDCTGSDGDPAMCSGPAADDVGHGSHVAGIAGAATGNGRGVAGVAPDVGLLVIRALSAGPLGARGSVPDVEAGIRWAVGHGADVINLSLGEVSLGVNGSGLEDAIGDAWAAGVVVVVAAGNEFLFPSGYEAVDALVVTATDRNDLKATYASTVGSAKWGMAAPGGDGDEDDQILSTWWQAGVANTYKYESGTSMAAPHVAGAAAVLRSLGLSPVKTVERLLSTARDLGAPGRDAVFGYGRLDLGAAVAGLRTPTQPVVTTTTGVVVPASSGRGDGRAFRQDSVSPPTVAHFGDSVRDSGDPAAGPEPSETRTAPGPSGDAPTLRSPEVVFEAGEDGEGVPGPVSTERGTRSAALAPWLALAAVLLALAVAGLRWVTPAHGRRPAA